MYTWRYNKLHMRPEWGRPGPVNTDFYRQADGYKIQGYNRKEGKVGDLKVTMEWGCVKQGNNMFTYSGHLQEEWQLILNIFATHECQVLNSQSSSASSCMRGNTRQTHEKSLQWPRGQEVSVPYY